jgi:hypothetical protein
VAKTANPLVLASLVLLAACAPYQPPAPRYLPVAPPPIYAEPPPAVTVETEQHQRQVVRHRRHRVHKRVVRRKVTHEETTAPAEAAPAPNPR